MEVKNRMKMAMPLALVLVFAAVNANAGELAENGLSSVEAPPVCVDNRGLTVTFQTAPDGELRKHGTPRVAASFRDPDVTGAPFVFLDVPFLAQTPPQFQLLTYYHECAHHELGHLDRHVTEYTREQKRVIEDEADCAAAGKLHRERNFSADDIAVLSGFLQWKWQAERRSSIYIRHRIGQLNACF